jgi:WD40 repeat protein
MASEIKSMSLQNITTWEIENGKEASPWSVHNAVWSSHNDELIATYGSTVAGWDVRSSKPTFERQRAHASSIRSVDYNRNKPHHIVTGGDDATMRIWDTRNLDSPLIEVVNHTHWYVLIEENNELDCRQLVFSKWFLV